MSWCLCVWIFYFFNHKIIRLVNWISKGIYKILLLLSLSFDILANLLLLVSSALTFTSLYLVVFHISFYWVLRINFLILFSITYLSSFVSTFTKLSYSPLLSSPLLSSPLLSSPLLSSPHMTQRWWWTRWNTWQINSQSFLHEKHSSGWEEGC